MVSGVGFVSMRGAWQKNPFLSLVTPKDYHILTKLMPDTVVSLPTMKSYDSWTVREHQNQKCAYDQGALILLSLLAGSYR